MPPPSSPEEIDEKKDKNDKEDERERAWLLPAPKSIMSFMCLTLAEWDSIITPNNPGRRMASRYVSGDLTETMAGHVENAIIKQFGKKCDHSTDMSPLDNLAPNDIRLYHSGYEYDRSRKIEREDTPAEHGYEPDITLLVYSLKE